MLKLKTCITTTWLGYKILGETDNVKKRKKKAKQTDAIAIVKDCKLRNKMMSYANISECIQKFMHLYDTTAV